ncbi:bifunctional demethylmenaquinone methyltransferase/2-methoxy-6-polyprenyl-1,4-benzoquinol methylase UbiE [Blattabacterium cuenoti]|uniref:bifunctional demethylmenaquinone methyltransferase/2-methoxy-6-polyprenyl-1,4-benzoquinol methylase UbiE n=1 Tax=Blattabacterium cuenoti TaxID=1653831 RepID=UPI00163C642E|nr:bifunctional demethylmenaquinone methyltransferase/2-methoxy-6-polyprenyl-1,4-benzoquinol methylase UbiE [Blattabacterium cuenoti]
MNKYSLSSREKKIKNMFDHISCKYDLINHILSFGIDFFWRKKVIHLLDKFSEKKKVKNILDLATGTGDLAILLAKKFDHARIIGLDPSKNMLKIAEKKIKNNNFEKRVKVIQGYSQNIPFKNEIFDMVTIAFGIRNFQYIHLSLREIYRILKPLGILVILEFSTPSNYCIKKIYHFYSHFIMNKIGNFLSKNNFAYNYLNESVQSFSYCYEKKMNKLLKYHQLTLIYIKKLTFEIATIYFSKKNT